MKKTKKATKTWAEIAQSERRTFPAGCCVTKVIPDKRNRKPKHKKGVYEE